MAAISLLLDLSGESAGEGFHKVKRADRYAITFEIVMLAAFLVLLGKAPARSSRASWPRSSGVAVAVGLVIPLSVDPSGLELPVRVPAALVLVGGSSCATSSSWPTLNYRDPGGGATAAPPPDPPTKGSHPIGMIHPRPPGQAALKRKRAAARS